MVELERWSQQPCLLPVCSPQDKLPLQSAGLCGPSLHDSLPDSLPASQRFPSTSPPRWAVLEACFLGSACSWRVVSRQLWAGLICMVFSGEVSGQLMFLSFSSWWLWTAWKLWFHPPPVSHFAFSLKGLKSTCLCRPVFCKTEHSLVCCHHGWLHRLGWHTTLAVVEGQQGASLKSLSAPWPR